ncbi:STE24 endopeptidase [Pancytospora philotis]|nr:STE24 endopeptidase [Pancytospora philotis]
MKRVYTASVVGALLLYLCILLAELHSEARFAGELDSGALGVPPDSYSYKLAQETPKWTENSRKASATRMAAMRTEILANAAVCLVISLALFKKVRTTVYGWTASMYTVAVHICPRAGLDTAEVHFVTVVLAFALCMGVGGFLRSAAWVWAKSSPIRVALLFACLLVLVLPLATVAILKLFEVFGAKLIAACYVALLLNFAFSVLALENVNRAKMQRISSASFSPAVQRALQANGLAQRVYHEKNPAPNPNAALVGWGARERIEIYGKFGSMDRQEFESVLLHEIAHSANRSLLFKDLVLCTTLLLEAALLAMLYSALVRSRKEGDMSPAASFLVLYVLYLLALQRWLSAVNRIASQVAELDADLSARAQGYGRPLAAVLFKISVKSAEYISPTLLYNVFRSDHPAVYRRVEYLSADK